MSNGIKPEKVIFEREKGPDGSTRTKATFDTADVALIVIGVLLLVFFIASIAIDDLRHELGPAVSALIGVMSLAVGGLGAYRIHSGKS